MSVEKLIENYYKAILLLTDEQDTLSALPTYDFKEFYSIMNGLISLLEEERQELQMEIETGKDKNLIPLFEEELKTYDLKIDICRKRVEMARQMDLESEQAETIDQKIKIVFAKTQTGRVYFLDDLKEIDQNEYGEVAQTLSELEQGDMLGNIEKGRHLTENKRLRGIKEAKRFQVRILYKRLAPGIIYVIQLLLKKTDMDNGIRNDMMIRNANTRDEFEYLSERIHDEEFTQQLIEANEEVLNEIYTILKTPKRGNN